jgi:hypothetical protein
MNGITVQRQARVFATVLALSAPLGLFFVAGCGGDTAQDGATVKEDVRPQQGIENMKSFMDKQKGATKK